MARLEVEIGAKIQGLLKELKKAKEGLSGVGVSANKLVGILNNVGDKTFKIGKSMADSLIKVKERLRDVGVAAEKLASKLKSVGEKMSNIGRDMAASLTLPLAAFAAFSAKTFASFEKDLAKIQGLVGIAGDKVEKMGDSALIMASKFGKSATEASEALFFITSAGLRGSDAMEVLEASLKASVIGLGDTKSIADLTTSAMNAYGVDVLSAAEATDILTASVREGKLDAGTLADSMGRVLPIASAMGVTFNQVGAAFAAMSRTGTNADEAATQLRGILSSLLSPASEAEKALKELGLSSAGLRQNIQDNGLLNTLEVLTQKFEGNSEKAALVFGNIRALSGVLDLMGKNVNGTREIFSNMNNTLGDTDKAFKIAAETADFKFKVAINSVRNSLVAVGKTVTNVFLPIVEKISKKLIELGKRFSELSPETRKVIVIIGGLVAALGPLLIALGFLSTTLIPALITGFGLLVSAVVSSATAFRTLTTAMIANPITAIVLGVAALVVGFTSMVQKITPAVSKLKTFFNLIRSFGNYSQFVALQIQDQVDAMTEEGEATKKASDNLKKFNKEQKATADAAKKAANELKAAADATLKLAAAKKSAAATAAATSVGGVSTISNDVVLRFKKETIGDEQQEDPLKLIDTNFDENYNDQQEFQNIDWVAYANNKALEKESLKLGEKLNVMALATQTASNAIGQSFNNMTSGIKNNLTEQLGAMGSFLGVFVDFIGQMIQAQLQQFITEKALAAKSLAVDTAFTSKKLVLDKVKATSNAVVAASNTAAASGPASAILLPLLIGGAIAAIGSAFSGISGGGGGGQTGSSNFSGSSGGGNFGASSGGEGGGGTVVFEIAGTKLVGVLSNTLARNRSLGGSLSLT